MTEKKNEETKKEPQVSILTQIQSELKVKKGQWNDYGKFYYRSAEDIESALKPLLTKYGAQLTFDEDVKEVGDRIYFVEIAHYKDSEQEITVKGWAREAESKKGMDASQISGSASSYATKYALAKLLLIDDTKDADGQKPTQTSAAKTPKISKEEQIYQVALRKAKTFKVDYGGGKELVTDIVGLEIDGDRQASQFLNDWCSKDKRHQKMYTFIQKHNLATHGMKVGA